MSVDVVCASAPFLDITFSGFDRMPALGEERMAEAVEYTPGGIANIALGLTRLGVDAAIWAPVGDDISGRVLNGLLAAEGIDWVGPPGAATAVSVVMPLNGDRGFLSACPEFEIDTDALAALEPRAVVIDLPVVERAPAGADVHTVVGDVDARRLAGHLPAALADARTLLANEPEALMLTGLDDVESAARALAGHGPTAVVTLAAGGALCAGEHGLVRAPAPEVTVVDTNGAGDLFTAAWVWADLAGVPPEERLQLAVAYASLSVRVATTRDGALTLDAFRREAQLLDAIIPPKGARR